VRAVDLIESKRDGRRLEDQEIAWLVEGLTRGDVPEYQWAALLMAIVWRGMDARETAALTRCMADSGTKLDLAHLPGPKIDKHSSGGVGDGTSLIIAPVAAACGVIVPMISGRGLGHTGGTLDKLESIPGFDTRLSLDSMLTGLERCGFVMVGQTDDVAPADRTLYALRDATGTVPSIPLITSSILSKKIVEGIDGLVLDVKTGRGAFLTEMEQSRQLARSLRETATALGLPATVLVTRMDEPLGRAVGNAVEVSQAIDVLRGAGPADIRDLSLRLVAEMILLAGIDHDLPAALARAQRAVDDGSALERFRLLVAFQGGDPRAIDDPSRLPQATIRKVVTVGAAGHVASIDARLIGQLCMKLGAGRSRMDDPIDHAAGILLNVERGDRVDRDTPAFTLVANDSQAIERVAAEIHSAIRIVDHPIIGEDRIVDRLPGRP
jgi:pyrimidine-nucleoside phosphorylase/thymidine phosphorylase